MASVNKVIIIGNLGRDPEVRSFDNGDSIANVTVATTDKWRDKQSGEAREATEWHRVTFFGKLAEIVGKYLYKGSPVYIEGSLRTREYTDKDGNKRHVTEIRADRMQMLGSKPDGQRDDRNRSERSAQRDQGRSERRESGGRQEQRSSSRGGSSGFDDMDDDIPF